MERKKIVESRNPAAILLPLLFHHEMQLLTERARKITATATVARTVGIRFTSQRSESLPRSFASFRGCSSLLMNFSTVHHLTTVRSGNGAPTLSRTSLPSMKEIHPAYSIFVDFQKRCYARSHCAPEAVTNDPNDPLGLSSDAANDFTYR